MDDLFLLGRVVFGGFFVFNGAHHLVSTAMLAEFAAEKGIPAPEAAVLGTGLLMLAGGLSILLGLWPHMGAACIILFLAVATPTMHDFWAAATPAQRAADFGNFTKNVALIGGALMMLGVPRPWPYSLESRRPTIPA